MTCLTDEILMAYHNFEFDDATNKKIEAHVAECKVCSERASFFKSLHEEWESPSVSPPSHFAATVLKETQKPRSQYRRKPRIYLQLACALVAAILFLQFNVAVNIRNITLNVVNYTDKASNKAEKFIKNGKGDVNQYIHEKRKENGGKNK